MMGTGTESATWYYVGSFGQLGPLTLDQLEELVDGGVIERETYVWNAGMPNWVPASQIPQLTASLSRRLPYMEPPPTPGHPRAQAAPTSTATPPPFGSPPVLKPGLSGVAQTSAYQLANMYATYAAPYAMTSDRSRVVAGILNIILPGIGRLYLGYSALGVIQLIATIASCGILQMWSVVDGIMILSGQVKIDGYGRILKD